jgi:hypothetical protein
MVFGEFQFNGTTKISLSFPFILLDSRLKTDENKDHRIQKHGRIKEIIWERTQKQIH